MPTEAGQALLDTFERIRIINLKHRADRRREMTRELARLGLQIDGRQIAFHDACRPTEAGPFPSVGARGCFTSHLDILAEASATGAKTVLILEDDLDFAQDAEGRMVSMLAELRSTPWSIFYGGYEQYAGALEDRPLTKADPAMAIRTTHFLAFSGETIKLAESFLRLLASRPAGHPEGGPMHVDGAYSWLRKTHPELLTLMAVPEIGHQRPSRTDIAELKLIDRIPGVRGITSALRRLKRQLSR